MRWKYDYDPAGRLVRETDFNGRTLTYFHDRAGRLAARTNGAGETVTFVRDGLGNVVEEHASLGVTTFKYDRAGRIIGAANADISCTFQRDVVGRIVAETCNGHTVSSTYDLVGRRVRRRTPSGVDSRWDYDPGGRPLALTTDGRTLRFRHDQAGREVKRDFDTGVTLAQEWDVNQRLAAQTVTVGGTGTTRETRLLQRRGYSYSLDGYVTETDDLRDGIRGYTLDSARRVTAVGGPNWQERYSYDSAGNIIDATWPLPALAGLAQLTTPDSAAQGSREYVGTMIRSAGTIRYEHDQQGRVTLRQQKRLSGKPLTWRYTWDADDRMTGVTSPDGQRWRYLYDPFGRRAAKQRLSDEDGVVEQIAFAWDGPVLAEQAHSMGNSVRVTTWEWEAGGFRPLSQSKRSASTSADQTWFDAQFHAIVTDPVGTATDLLNPDGRVDWHARPTLWGATATPNSGDVDCPLRFPGQYHDPETGLNYNYHRYYDPTTGRYTSNDPFGLAPAPNPHTYVHNPLTYLDPFGLAPGDCDNLRSLHADVAAKAAALNKPIVVIGSIDDTRIAAKWPGHDVLYQNPWSPAINDDWVANAGRKDLPVYIASPITKENLWNVEYNRPRVFARELSQFYGMGYQSSGDYLLPQGW